MMIWNQRLLGRHGYRQRVKLIGGSTIDDARSIQLATVLLNRGAITRTMYDLVADHIKITETRSLTSSNPSEEL